jgi:hypothetical protein
VTWIKKYIKRIVLGVVLALTVSVILAIVWIDWLAKAGIETAGTMALGVATTVDRVKIGILAGDFSMSGLQVANPSGFRSSHFLKLDDGAIDVSLGTLIQGTVEVPVLTLSGIHMNLVKESGQANFRTIIDNLAKFEATRNTPDAPAEKGSRKKFIFREVLIRDVDVLIDLLPLGGKLTQLTVKIDELRLEDVGAEGNRGETLARVTATVVRALLDAVIEKGETILPPELLSELREKMGGLQPLKALRSIIKEPLLPGGGNGPIRTRLRERKSRRENTSRFRPWSG